MKRLLRIVTLGLALMIALDAGQTLVMAQGYNYSRRYSTTLNSMSSRAAARAALRKAKQRRAKQTRSGRGSQERARRTQNRTGRSQRGR